MQLSARGAAVDPSVRQPGPTGGDGLFVRPGQRAPLLGQVVQGQRRVLPLHAQPASAQSAVSRPRRRHGREFSLDGICMRLLWDLRQLFFAGTRPNYFDVGLRRRVEERRFLCCARHDWFSITCGTPADDTTRKREKKSALLFVRFLSLSLAANQSGRRVLPPKATEWFLSVVKRGIRPALFEQSLLGGRGIPFWWFVNHKFKTFNRMLYKICNLEFKSALILNLNAQYKPEIICKIKSMANLSNSGAMSPVKLKGLF